MARSFDGGSDQYLAVDGTPPVTGPPCTIACWVKADDATNFHMPMWIGDKDIEDSYIRLQLAGDEGGDPAKAEAVEPGDNLKAEFQGFSASTWYLLAGVYVETGPNIDSARVYLNNNTAIDSSPNIAPTGWDRFAIGRSAQSTPAGPMYGAIAEVGVWDVAFAAADIAQLVAKYCPLFVKRQNLVSYLPLIRDDRDRVGSWHMTAYNSPTWAAHPPIIYPAPPFIPFPSAAAPAGLSIPVAMRTYRNMRM